ncbi:RCC1 domain-containing protein [Corallococcus sp. M7]
MATGCKDSSVAAVDVFTSLQLETPDENVASVQVTVSGPDMPARTVTLKKEAGRWSGVLRAVPVGAGHTFVGAALDGSGARLHEATVSDVALTEEAGSAAVYLLLPSSQPDSDVPVVTSLVASPGDLSVGQAVSLTATVRGSATGGAPVAAWTSSVDGDFSDSGALKTTWTGSRVADGALTLTLTQARGPSGVLTVKLPVHNAKPLSEVLFNVWPSVRFAQAAPQVSVGEGAALAVTSVDPEGETLTYAWTAGCVGVFEDSSAASTRFTPTAQPPVADCKPCDLTVTVTDPHGGRAQEKLSTCVKPGPALPPVLAEGTTHFLAIRAGGTVWAWGGNALGQLGTGSTANLEPVPAQVPGLTDIVSVAAGTGHSLALRADGTLFGWGDNSYGQLADEDLATIRRAPVVVEGLPRIASIAAVNVHSLVLGVDGTVWSWGNGSAIPSRVDLPPGISGVSTELTHGVALHETGAVFTWANGVSQEATAPTRLDSLSGIVAISSAMSSSLALGADGTVYTWGPGAQQGSRTVPLRVPGLSRVAAIGGGGAFNSQSTALREDGSLYTWFFYFPEPTRVASLPAMSRLGQSSCFAQRADGAVFTWCTPAGDVVQVFSASPAGR